LFNNYQHHIDYVDVFSFQFLDSDNRQFQSTSNAFCHYRTSRNYNGRWIMAIDKHTPQGFDLASANKYIYEYDFNTNEWILLSKFSGSSKYVNEPVITPNIDVTGVVMVGSKIYYRLFDPNGKATVPKISFANGFGETVMIEQDYNYEIWEYDIDQNTWTQLPVEGSSFHLEFGYGDLLYFYDESALALKTYNINTKEITQVSKFQVPYDRPTSTKDAIDLKTFRVASNLFLRLRKWTVFDTNPEYQDITWMELLPIISLRNVWDRHTVINDRIFSITSDYTALELFPPK